MNDLKLKSPAPVEKASTFGFNPRPRRKARPMPIDTRTNEELVAEYLANNKTITRCETRYADGAVKTSGSYEF